MPVTAPSKMRLPKLPNLPRVPRLPKRERSVARSQTERLWLIAGGLIAFVMFLIGYFFFISPQRSDTSSVNGQVAEAQQRNTVLQARIDALREQNKNLAKYQSDLAKARLALPTTSGIPDFLRTLQALGNATLTDVSQLSVGQPTDASLATGPLPTTGATAAASPAAGGSTVRPSVSVYALPINATVSGSAPALEKFLDQLQAVQPRAVLITSITESAVAAGQGQGGATTSLQLSMTAFVAPASPAVGTSLSSAASH